MTMWTFGDSFCLYFKFLPESWVNRTALMLGLSVNNFCKTFSSLEYTFYNFDRAKDKFIDGDIVIVGLTNIYERFWPTDSKPVNTNTIDFYKTNYEVDDDRRKEYLIKFIEDAEKLVKEKNIHIVVIINGICTSSWVRPLIQSSSLNFTIGELIIVSEKEFDDSFKQNMTDSEYGWLRKHDFRINHMCKSNHTILSDKMIANIKNKIPINLTQGFKEKIINQNSLTDSEFVKDELFDNFQHKLWRIGEKRS